MGEYLSLRSVLRGRARPSAGEDPAYAKYFKLAPSSVSVSTRVSCLTRIEGLEFPSFPIWSRSMESHETARILRALNRHSPRHTVFTHSPKPNVESQIDSVVGRRRRRLRGSRTASQLAVSIENSTFGVGEWARLSVRGSSVRWRVFWRATGHVLECVGTLDRTRIGYLKRTAVTRRERHAILWLGRRCAPNHKIQEARDLHFL